MKNHAPHHKNIADILGSVHDRDHYTVIRDFFELSAISIRNNFDHGNEKNLNLSSKMWGGGTRAANATIRYALTHTGADVRTIANTVMPNRF